MKLKRSSDGLPLGRLPDDIPSRVRDWNGRVLALADEALTIKERGDVEVFPAFQTGLIQNFGIAQATQLAELVESNIKTLRTIEQRGRRSR